MNLLQYEKINLDLNYILLNYQLVVLVVILALGEAWNLNF